MRELPKFLKIEESKKELLRLSKIDLNLKREECIDENGKEYDEREKDKIWGEKNKNDFIWHLTKAKDYHEIKKELDTPIELLKAALKKLNHDNMDASSIKSSDFPQARKLAFEIKKRADELESEFFNIEKNMKKDLKSLTQKYKTHKA
jgi:hypothetical protein